MTGRLGAIAQRTSTDLSGGVSSLVGHSSTLMRAGRSGSPDSSGSAARGGGGSASMIGARRRREGGGGASSDDRSGGGGGGSERAGGGALPPPPLPAWANNSSSSGVDIALLMRIVGSISSARAKLCSPFCLSLNPTT